VSPATDDPPTLIVCINRLSRTNALFKGNGVMAVNVLAAGREDLAVRFSNRRDGAELFPEDDWTMLHTGSPVLSHALVSFDGWIVKTEEIGTHTVFFVEVAASGGDPDAGGLAYFRRRYVPLD
jgi:flavin reductase